jgi:hypothetical protein
MVLDTHSRAAPSRVHGASGRLQPHDGPQGAPAAARGRAEPVTAPLD